FARLGYGISRSNMINWAIQLGKILKPLIELLRQSVLSGPLIQMDETTIQVLKEKDRAPTYQPTKIVFGLITPSFNST
ncbi:MAG: transposase, partial [Deltaproteobacteria bacterium]|nr:transposase [Deltaproteobacteria bacterium]